MIDIDLKFIGTISDNELKRLLKPENREELEQRQEKYRLEIASEIVKGAEDT